MKTKFTHQMMLDAIIKLSNDITNSDYKVDLIIAVARGGLVPGVYLSHKLNKPLRIVEYSTRDNMTGTSSLEWLSVIKNAIIVDDIADSGVTLNSLVDINPYLPTAVLVQKEMSDHNATFHGVRVSGNEWVEFDWEV